VLAAVLLHVVWRQFGGEPHPLAVIAACVAGALASLALQRFVIILGTAYGGAWTLLIGVLTLMGHRGASGAAATGDLWMAYPLNPAPGERWVPIAWLVLGTLGTLIQLMSPARGGKTGRARARRATAA
jgi:hypothetical protein